MSLGLQRSNLLSVRPALTQLKARPGVPLSVLDNDKNLQEEAFIAYSRRWMPQARLSGSRTGRSDLGSDYHLYCTCSELIGNFMLCHSQCLESILLQEGSTWLQQMEWVLHGVQREYCPKLSASWPPSLHGRSLSHHSYRTGQASRAAHLVRRCQH